MKLSYEDIRSICTGTVRSEQTDKGIKLYRMTEAQCELYKQIDDNFYRNALTAAGIKLYFETDSTSLFLHIHASRGTHRTYFSFDVAVNGAVIGSLDNFSNVSLPLDYTMEELPLGNFSKQFSLGEGTKTVCIYLPRFTPVEILEISIDDSAFLKPLKQPKRMLVFGDSITQGYDGLHPSRHHAARVADALQAEEFNKGIGGDIYRPALANLPDTFSPDYILVSYGCNDWALITEAEFLDNCRAFYEALNRHYPNATIFALTPIRRQDYLTEVAFGSFRNVAADINMIAKDFKNVICIDGFDFVPEGEEYYADVLIHPSDNGFDHYYHNLIKEIQKSIGAR